MRVIVLTHGAADLVLEKLGNLENIEIAGVFIETSTTPNRRFAEKIRRSIKYDGITEIIKKLFSKLSGGGRNNGANRETAAGMRETTIAKAKALGHKIHEVENFHSERSIGLLREADADLGVVFGTNIIKENVFSIPRLGSINLHQGLAPYYRGGPPIFWELFNGEKEIGITVHFVAAKVDTGDIILQKTVPLEYDKTYGDNFESFISDFQKGLREASANLIAESVRKMAAGDVLIRPQDISLGKRYRLPIKKEKDELRRRLRVRLKRGAGA